MPYKMDKTLVRLMLTLMVTTMGASGAIKCHVWREILPCECEVAPPQTRVTSITCSGMMSFAQVADILRGHFHHNDRVNLKLEKSDLRDLQFRQFRELNFTIENLKLTHDYVGFLNVNSFGDMSRVNYVSFADTPIDNIPRHLWRFMPNVVTVDLGRTKIKEILYGSFDELPNLKTIVIPGNQISRIDRNSIPLQLQRLHLGRNKIHNLNGSVTGLRDLNWLFLNCNEFVDLEGQLPYEAPHLRMIHASENRLTRIPQLTNYPSLETVFLNYNEITSLDEAFSGCKALERIEMVSNQIRTLTSSDFFECEALDNLHLAYNQITTLNHSLIPLKSLETFNLSHNLLTEFSFNEIIGLERLRRVDLSYNQLVNLIGPASNLVEPNIGLTELQLNHNMLETLNAALSGLSELLRLDLSYNRLRRILPDDLINLDQLRLLDISHNQLKSLEEMSKTYLPRLSQLIATHNELSILERDFHGLPVLCNADLSNNQIVALGRELVTKTRCKIEHGVHDGTYDILKILLSDNPILCDAALPEITSEFETNHTKVSGVSYCPPLNEQPITHKPNAYLGYIPEQATESAPPVLPPIYAKQPPLLHSSNEPPNQIQSNIHPDLRDGAVLSRRNYQYDSHNTDGNGDSTTIVRQPVNDEPIAVTLHKTMSFNGTQSMADPSKVKLATEAVFDPIVQGQVINKLASEIEELKTRIEEIGAQNERLLNKTISEQANLTTKVP